MITFFTSSGCKLCFLVPGITHSQETNNHNKQQFHLLVFSDDSLISKETEKQNEVCNMGVAWPFWQVRKRVHMILKTSYKITFLLSFNAKLVVYRLVYDRTWKKKSFYNVLLWAGTGMFSAAQEDALFCVHKFGVQKHRLEELRLVNICVNFPHA